MIPNMPLFIVCIADEKFAESPLVITRLHRSGILHVRCPGNIISACKTMVRRRYNQFKSQVLFIGNFEAGLWVLMPTVITDEKKRNILESFR